MKHLIAFVAFFAITSCAPIMTWPVNGTYSGAMVYHYNKDGGWTNPRLYPNRAPQKYSWSNEFTLDLNADIRAMDITITTTKSPYTLENGNFADRTTTIKCSGIFWYIN